MNDIAFKWWMRLLVDELHLIERFGKGSIRVKVNRVFSEKKARKWMWAGLVAFAAVQIYFVQEMLAALLLFTGLFVVLAIIALVFYLIDRAGQWSLEWAEQNARPAVQLARRGWTLAEDLSKRTFRRPRSEPAQ